MQYNYFKTPPKQKQGIDALLFFLLLTMSGHTDRSEQGSVPSIAA